MNPEELAKARDLAKHRGPDDAGFWHQGQVGLGHRRLSILGPDGKSKQPFTYRHVTVIHNGEIYNYLEIRETLQKAGYVFETASDTEVLAAAYCHWGTSCVREFNGIWTFVIYE